MEIMESFLLHVPFYNGVLSTYMCANFSEEWYRSPVEHLSKVIFSYYPT